MIGNFRNFSDVYYERVGTQKFMKFNKYPLSFFQLEKLFCYQ